MGYQSIINNLGNSIFDLDNIAQYSSNFPEDWRTNPIGSYGVGMQSDARHQAASARASDKFNDMLNFSLVPRPLQGLLSDSVSFAGGVGVEGVGSFKDWIMSGFKDKNYLEAAKQDIISDWKGTFGTPYGTPTRDIMNNVYNSNGYNIFNKGTIDPSEFVRTTPAQGPAGFTEPVDTRFADDIVDDARRSDLVSQSYTKPSASSVSTVSPGAGNSRRGTPSYAQQAAAVNKKAKSMGVASPIRRSGNKYGFGL
jgi:hypothetical protein